MTCASGSVVFPAPAGYAAGGVHTIVVQTSARLVEVEHVVESGDLDRLLHQGLQRSADDHEPARTLRVAVCTQQRPESGRVEEGDTRQIHSERAVRELREDLSELGGGREVDLAGDLDEVSVADGVNDVVESCHGSLSRNLSASTRGSSVRRRGIVPGRRPTISRGRRTGPCAAICLCPFSPYWAITARGEWAGRPDG